MRGRLARNIKTERERATRKVTDSRSASSEELWQGRLLNPDVSTQTAKYVYVCLLLCINTYFLQMPAKLLLLGVCMHTLLASVIATAPGDESQTCLVPSFQIKPPTVPSDIAVFMDSRYYNNLFGRSSINPAWLRLNLGGNGQVRQQSERSLVILYCLYH